MMKSRNHRKRNHIVLRRFSVLLAVCASVFLAACGKGGTAGGDPGSGGLSGENSDSGSAQKKEWVYVPEVVTVEDGHADYERMQLAGDTFCYVSQGEDTGSGEKCICRYSLADRKLQRVPISWDQGGDNWDVGERFFDRDCNLYMTANVYPADYSSMTRFLCKFDPEGNCLFSRDITEQLGRGASLEGLTVDGQGRLYIFADGGEILLYTGEGEYHGSVGFGSSGGPALVQFRGACDGVDGKYYVCVGKGNVDMAGAVEGTEGIDGDGFLCTLMEIDFEGVQLSEIAENLPDIKGLCPGKQLAGNSAGQGEEHGGQSGEAQGHSGEARGQSGGTEGQNGGTQGQSGEAEGHNGGSEEQSDNPVWQYDFLLYDERAVYGFQLSGQKSASGSAGKELFAWMDSDINGYCVANLYLKEDGKLCATVADWNNDDKSVVILKRTKADQAPRKKELVLATVDGAGDLAAMAVKFNRGNSQYHLTVEHFEAVTDLYNAVLTREPVDLIDLSGIHVQNLAVRGFFEDLAPYVERSEAFGRSDFVDGIMDVYTFDNQLAGIPASFTLRTVVGNGVQQEETAQAGLALEDLLASADRHPGVRDFDGLTKEEMMRYIMMFNEETFIDWDNGACRFDSEAFRAILEYVNRYPDSTENGMEETTLPVKIRNGEVLYAIAELNEYRAFQEFGGMFGETAACVGFPTPEGKGGHLLFTRDAYAIAAGSEHKEGAWKFIEGFLAQEKSGAYYGSLFSTSFPTLKKVLKEQVEEAIERDSQYESDRFPERIYSDGSTFQFHALTWDEVNVILDLVPDAKPYFDVEGDEILQIINEEASGYYSGQRGAGDVAGIIQNRVQLYVNENSR